MNDTYETQFQDIWRDLLRKYPNAKPCVNPQGFVLGGQPGAGKSNLLEKIANHLDGNVLIINADEFRRYHPQFDEIQAQYGDDAPKYTAKFSGKMAEQILNNALTEHYNIAIEGTFRTAQTPLNTLDLMKSHGYKTAVHIQTCPKSLSWQSTIKRYDAMIKAGMTPRAVDKAHHDLVCDRLPENADIVYQSGKADEFQVYSRNSLIFDGRTTKDLPSIAISKELNALTQEEALSALNAVVAEFYAVGTVEYQCCVERNQETIKEIYTAGKSMTNQMISHVRDNYKQKQQSAEYTHKPKSQDKGGIER
ncbi:MAG: zeta toxin family protein [Neisseriaceae bacterium]|nr:zeta toxin family protein [Neisseriaceae bacterium]